MGKKEKFLFLQAVHSHPHFVCPYEKCIHYQQLPLSKCGLPVKCHIYTISMVEIIKAHFTNTTKQANESKSKAKGCQHNLEQRHNVKQ